jgi:hypothetical protein
MRAYTLEPIRLETDAASPNLYRLYVDGEPTVIAIRGEEAALLRNNGHIVDRRALEAIFKCSPARRERLDRIPDHFGAECLKPRMNNRC